LELYHDGHGMDGLIETRMMGLLCVTVHAKKMFDIFSRFDTIQECDGRTNGRKDRGTPDDSWCRTVHSLVR